ncbi:MAG: rhodanese-like domain-containing protein [Akkermansiaceae bacterium]|nr:rhodanese-like domain-containing protein [Akkermansiaceae bacterium]
MKTEDVKKVKKGRLGAGELRELLEAGGCELVDVREAVEYAGKRIPGARHLPLGKLDGTCGELPADGKLVLMCRSGKRSAKAAEILRAKGFENVAELEGGLQAWEEAGLETEQDARAPWPLERQVRIAAGALVLAGLAASLWWPAAVALAWFVGAGLVFAGLTDWCGMGMLLAKAPWNRRGPQGACAAGGGITEKA